MTLIATFVSELGIVHATDSNLTFEKGPQVEEAPKVFDVPGYEAGVSIAGAYGVGGERIDQWLPRALASAAHRASSLGEIASTLANRFSTEMTDGEIDCGTLLHLAGYTADSGETHPELWFVRNIEHIDAQTGDYSDPSRQFRSSEDYWARDRLASGHADLLQHGGYQSYVNGLAPGANQLLARYL